MGRAPLYKIEIAALRKNSCERLHVSLEEYNGTDLTNLAVKRDGTGKHRLNGMKATARFVSIQTRLLPDLIRALQGAEARAIAEGLLQAPSESTSERNCFASPVMPETAKPFPVATVGPVNAIVRR